MNIVIYVVCNYFFKADTKQSFKIHNHKYIYIYMNASLHPSMANIIGCLRIRAYKWYSFKWLLIGFICYKWQIESQIEYPICSNEEACFMNILIHYSIVATFRPSEYRSYCCNTVCNRLFLFTYQMSDAKFIQFWNKILSQIDLGSLWIVLITNENQKNGPTNEWMLLFISY